MIYARTAVEKVCPKCNSTFYVERKVDIYSKVTPLSDEKTFCSRKCANSRIHTEETKKKIGKTLTGRISGIMLKRKPIACPICKIIFMPKKKNQKYCSKKCTSKIKIVGAEAPHPFKGYYVYPPIYHKRIDRYMIVLTSNGTNNKLKITSMSFARYNLSVHLGRKLQKTEHVDHINGNRKDDRIANLQILSAKENNRKSVIERNKTKKIVELICPVCTKKFTRDYHQIFLGRGKKHQHDLATCSKECSGKISTIGKENLENKVIKIYRKGSIT